MARKSRNHHFDLPPLELRCLAALWDAGQATVHEIRAQLLPSRPLAYTTVMTVMDRLARKGVVEREKRGRAHLYRPAVTREAISEHALQQMVENFFRGSYDELIRHLQNGGPRASVNAPVEPGISGRVAQADSPSRAENKVEPFMDTSLL